MINNTQPKNFGIINSSSSILGCFTRSFDKHHSGNMHLISSVLYIEKLTWKNIINLIDINERNGNENDTITIFIVSNNLKTENRENEMLSKDMGKVRVIFTTLSYLIGQLTFNKSKDVEFTSFFGNNYTTYKNFDHLYSKSLFIFSDLTWSNVVLSFKLSGINISGGTISKRHILDSVHYQLINYINILGIDEYQMKKIIYDSSRNPILSQSIPIDFYEFLYEQLSKVIHMDRTHFLNYLKNIDDRKLKYYGKIFIDNSESYHLIENIKKFVEINYSLATTSLKKCIQNNYDYKIDELENKIKRLESEYKSNANTLEYNHDLLNGLLSYSTNNQKKKLKKERKELEAKNVNGIAESLISKNKQLLEQITELNNEMMLIKKEKDLFIEKQNNLSIFELNKIHSKEKNFTWDKSK